MVPLQTGVPTPKVRVLVADDADIIVRTLAVILDLAGYDACALYSGEAALRLLNLLKPDLVVTDVTSAGLTGYKCTGVTPFALPRCKILMFTGHIDLYSFFGGEEADTPPFELLTRPILPEDLLSKLKNLCSECPPLLVPIDLTDANVH